MRARGLILLLSLATFAGCSSSSKGVGPSPPKPGDRVLAISMNPRQEPPATVADFLAAFDLAHGAAFADMVTVAAGKPVLLQELGYPSSALLESSDAEQAAFFTDAIAAWAAIDATTMPFLSIFLLHDLTQQQCDLLGTYYGFPNSTELEAFLCSLGLRTVNGTPKAAWSAVTRAARDAALP